VPLTAARVAGEARGALRILREVVCRFRSSRELLRVLEERGFERLEGTATVTLDEPRIAAPWPKNAIRVFPSVFRPNCVVSLGNSSACMRSRPCEPPVTRVWNFCRRQSNTRKDARFRMWTVFDYQWNCIAHFPEIPRSPRRWRPVSRVVMRLP
jgi:hypothetical protein